MLPPPRAVSNRFRTAPGEYPGTVTARADVTMGYQQPSFRAVDLIIRRAVTPFRGTTVAGQRIRALAKDTASKRK
jgi:hypothetical protein